MSERVRLGAVPGAALAQRVHERDQPGHLRSPAARPSIGTTVAGT